MLLKIEIAWNETVNSQSELSFKIVEALILYIVVFSRLTSFPIETVNHAV